MLTGFALILGFLLVGDAVSNLLHLFVPGPIVGLLLLFGWLQVRAHVGIKAIQTIDTAELEQFATLLLGNLGILFVPPGVGVVRFLDLFVERGAAILCVVTASTLLTMIVTALVFQMSQRLAKRHGWMQPRVGGPAAAIAGRTIDPLAASAEDRSLAK
jgi:holin-like protein